MLGRHVRLLLAIGAAPVLVVVSCAPPGTVPNPPGAASPVPASPSPARRPSPSPKAAFPSGPAFVLLRSTEITTGARMNFQGQGFLPGEQATVAIEDGQGDLEVSLDRVVISKDGTFDEVSMVVPDGLNPGEHQLHLLGASSGRSARTRFNLRQITPSITLHTYSAKSDHTFSFSGSGFAPGELVDVHLGGLAGGPLGSFPSDAQGNVVAANVPLPLIQAGEYLLFFVGERSQTPISVGFNVQGFSPWVVLDNYAVPPYSVMGFSGEDFVPGEQIEVYLAQRSGDPLIRVAADPNGHFAVKNAFNLPDLVHGNQTLIFVAHQSATEIAVKFVVLPFSPGLELTGYAGRPGTPIAFNGSGWARNEKLQAYVGESDKALATKLVVTFQADASGSFTASGEFRLPIGTRAGGVPITVKGEISRAEVTLWYQALQLKASAELTAYRGPPGTVIAFTGRSFAGGERVSAHLRDRGGPELASGIADDDGTIVDIGSYPIAGNWGDDIHFVLVGGDSGTQAATDFKIENATAPP